MPENVIQHMESEVHTMTPVLHAIADWLKKSGLALEPGWHRFSIFVAPSGEGYHFDHPKLVKLMDKEEESR
jgi:hypothetical protein